MSWSEARAAWRRAYFERYPRKKKQHRDTIRSCQFKLRYGITLEQRNEMLRSQRGRCAICVRRIGARGQAHVDHCHRTGRVRGLLCFFCNTALGKLDDNIVLMRRAIRYLTRKGKR